MAKKKKILLGKTATQTAKQTANFFSSSFKQQTSTALIAAFGFIVALAWRDFIIQIVGNLTKSALLEQYPYLAQLYTAVIITIIAIIGITLVSKWAKKEEK